MAVMPKNRVMNALQGIGEAQNGTKTGSKRYENRTKTGIKLDRVTVRNKNSLL